MSLSNYLKEQIAKKGYGNMEVYYSLGHCQGDGVSWRGALYSADAMILAARVMDGRDLFRVLKAIHEGGSLRIGHNNNHYYHVYTMTVESDGLPSGVEEAISGTHGKSLSADALQKEVQQMEIAWNRFTDAILEDVRSISREIESIGYAISDSMLYESETVKEITTQNYRVEIQHVPDDSYLEYAHNEELEDLVAGNYNVACVTVMIYEIHDDRTENEIGNASLGGVMYNTSGNSQYLRKVWRQVLREAVTEARTVRFKPKKRKNSFKIAA